jgi:hypothetical protein
MRVETEAGRRANASISASTWNGVVRRRLTAAQTCLLRSRQGPPRKPGAARTVIWGYDTLSRLLYYRTRPSEVSRNGRAEM